MFGWSVKRKPIQEELFVYIWVGSFISCRKLSGICEKHLVSSVILTSLDHQEDNQSLKSPVITDKHVLLFFKVNQKFSKLNNSQFQH